MAEYVQEQDRLISGKGQLKIVADPVKFRHAYVLLDVIRPPTNLYLNYNYNPPRSRYATLTFRRQGYVVDTCSMEFERERVDIVNDITGQNLIAIKCAYDGILQTFVNLSIALANTPGGVGLQPITKVDAIKDYEYLTLAWDEILIKCYADTALQVRLFTLLHDTCDPEKDKGKEPPPPPPPLPKLPAGTPIGNISPPYDDPDTDDETEPNPLDEIAPTPGILRVTYEVGANGSVPGGDPVTVDIPVPDSIYTPELRAGLDPPPGSCATVPGIAIPQPPLQTTAGVTEDGVVVKLLTHNTCNLLSILDWEFIPAPPP